MARGFHLVSSKFRAFRANTNDIETYPATGETQVAIPSRCFLAIASNLSLLLA
jgi:hypothetical protein